MPRFIVISLLGGAFLAQVELASDAEFRLRKPETYRKNLQHRRKKKAARAATTAKILAEATKEQSPQETKEAASSPLAQQQPEPPKPLNKAKSMGALQELLRQNEAHNATTIRIPPEGLSRRHSSPFPERLSCVCRVPHPGYDCW